MSIKPLSNGVFTFVTTNACTAMCTHCLMNCKPILKDKLTFEQMRKSIDQIVKNYSVHLVVFTGGEPTLLGEDLFRAIRYCSLNFLRTRLVTNAHWATTLERAQKYVQKFRDAGLTELNVSIDDYHAPFVPLENIRNFWNSSKSVGFESVLLANSHGPKDKINPAFIQKFLGEKIIVGDNEKVLNSTKNTHVAKDGTMYMIFESSLQKSGRAHDLDSKKFISIKKQNHLSVPCKWAVQDPVISPLGHIWACCGIPSDNNPVLDMGDANKEKIKTILERGADNILLNALHYLGPYKLCKFVEEHSKIRFKQEFYSVCEVCSALTNNKKAIDVLRKNYATLVPIVLAEKELVECIC